MLVDIIVIATLSYMTVIQSLGGWLNLLRRGEAVSPVPRASGRTWPAWAQIGFMLLGVVIAIPFVYFLWVPLPMSVSPAAANALRIVGLAAYLVGFGLIVWGRRVLGSNWGISNSREVRLRPDHVLVESGPFAYIRHPMYLGWWLSLAGLVAIYWNWLPVVLLVMSLASFGMRARLEEKVLAERFGDAWEAYVARTGFVVPRLGGRDMRRGR